MGYAGAVGGRVRWVGMVDGEDGMGVLKEWSGGGGGCHCEVVVLAELGGWMGWTVD